MDTKKIKKTLNTFIQRVEEKYKPAKVILFGSYARGEATEYSDVDIVVVSDAFKRKTPYNRFSELHSLAADLEPDVNAFGLTTKEAEGTIKSITLRDAIKTGVTISASK